MYVTLYCEQILRIKEYQMCVYNKQFHPSWLWDGIAHTSPNAIMFPQVRTKTNQKVSISNIFGWDLRSESFKKFYLEQNIKGALEI